jgi:hypothetical protein
VGAFAGALVVPLLLGGAGLRAVTLLAFCCYVAAIACTVLIREPKAMALDDVSEDLIVTPAEASAAMTSESIRT